MRALRAPAASTLEAIAQIVHAIVGRLHSHGLVLDDAADVDRQVMVFEHFAVFGDRGIFAALAFLKNGAVIPAAQRRLQMHPSAMESRRHASFGLHLLAKVLRQAFQFARKILALRRKVAEEEPEVIVPHVLRRRSKTLLRIFARRNKPIEG